MKKLEGRDIVNKHSIAKKVNEIIDVLEKKEIIEKEKTLDEELRKKK